MGALEYVVEANTITDGCITRRLIAGRTYDYTYNGMGQLVGYTNTQDSSKNAEFKYDHAANRVWMKVGNDQTRFVYDGQDVVAEYVDLGGDGTIDRKRVYWNLPEIDQRIGFADISGSTTSYYYYICDQVGSVLQVVDSSGNVQNQYDYDAFGNVRWDSPLTFTNVENRYLFQGREWDEKAGHYYFRYRTYIGEWGMFSGPDRNLGNGIEGEGLGVGSYLAMGNNPLSVRDPEGLKIEIAPINEAMLDQMMANDETAQIYGKLGVKTKEQLRTYLEKYRSWFMRVLKEGVYTGKITGKMKAQSPKTGKHQLAAVFTALRDNPDVNIVIEINPLVVSTIGGHTDSENFLKKKTASIVVSLGAAYDLAALCHEMMHVVADVAQEGSNRELLQNVDIANLVTFINTQSRATYVKRAGQSLPGDKELPAYSDKTTTKDSGEFACVDRIRKDRNGKFRWIDGEDDFKALGRWPGMQINDYLAFWLLCFDPKSPKEEWPDPSFYPDSLKLNNKEASK